MAATANDKILKACEDALEKIQQAGSEELHEVKSKLEYVIGSYRFDQNPVGLYEIGAMALEKLKELKAQKPRQISKKLITDLEKALSNA